MPDILKNKWVWIGGGGVILIVLFMSSGSSGAVVAQGGPSDAEIMAQRDITIAQLSAQGQTNASQAQIAIINAQSNAEIAKAGLEGQLQQYAIDANVALQSMQISNSRDISLANEASQERRELAAQNAQLQIAHWTLEQQLNIQESNNAFQLDYAEAANATAVSLQQMQAALVNNQLLVNRDVTLAGLATQVDMAAIYANLQLNTTYSNNQTQVDIYNKMSDTDLAKTKLIIGEKKQKNTLGAIGSIVGGIASIFSDPRLKTNIVKLGEESDGLGIYSFTYVWGGGVQVGVMADEVAAIRPWALGPTIGGYRTVNYGLL